MHAKFRSGPYCLASLLLSSTLASACASFEPVAVGDPEREIDSERVPDAAGAQDPRDAGADASQSSADTTGTGYSMPDSSRSGDGADAGSDAAQETAADGQPGAGSAGTETVCDKVGAEVTLCDDFNGSSLDLKKWWFGRKHWGPKPPRNHGVIPENVSVHNGKASFAANGDKYSGPLQGVRKAAGYIQDQPGFRSGGVIVSDAYFGSGKYEIRMKLPRSTGVCTALWTFHYQEIYEGKPGYDRYLSAGNVRQGNANDGYYVVANHEIDVEVPTQLKGQPENTASYKNARYNTWIGESASEYTDAFFGNGVNLSDGRFHTWRFDWHTGGSNQSPRVEFYVDDQLKYTSTTHIPTVKGRLTLGTWFPEWAGGVAAFDVEYLEVDWVRVSAFSEPNDQSVVETFPNDGMTKCNKKQDNDANKPECRLAVY